MYLGSDPRTHAKSQTRAQPCNLIPGKMQVGLLPNQVSQTGELQTNEGLILKDNINIAVEKGSNQWKVVFFMGNI